MPVYIQEKVDPRALVENLRATAAVPEDKPELRRFDDFDGLPFDDLVDFYGHEGNWSNRMILGDPLLVMNSLATKERMAGKVQMVFIDPPYGECGLTLLTKFVEDPRADLDTSCRPDRPGVQRQHRRTGPSQPEG